MLCIFVVQVMWAFCVYVESVSVLPQLRMMQKAKARRWLACKGGLICGQGSDQIDSAMMIVH